MLLQVNAAELLEPLTLAVHKPAGYVCSRARDGGEETRIVFDLLPGEWCRRRPPLGLAGRLDKEARGLVLVTQEGRWVNDVLGGGHEREYVVETKVPVTSEVVDTFAEGSLMLRGESVPLKPAKLTLEPDNGCRVRLVLTEGRYHQVSASSRRFFVALAFSPPLPKDPAHVRGGGQYSGEHYAHQSGWYRIERLARGPVPKSDATRNGQRGEH